MKDIAFKKEGLLWVYILLLAASVFLLIFETTAIKGGEKSFTMVFTVVYLAICGFSIYVIIRIIKLPKILIQMDDNDVIYLYSGEKINPSEIIDVSHKLAYGRGIRYKWGKLIIDTANNSFYIPCMADVEKVSKTLLLLSQKHKSQN